jgi:hypothetical protein
MCIHTSEQQKAQAELNAIIGTDRLPTVADRPHLPYVEALYCEVIRKYFGGIGAYLLSFIFICIFHPKFHFHLTHPPSCNLTGPPHMLREDDIYDGYFIPKGAIILTNVWSVCSIIYFYTIEVLTALFTFAYLYSDRQFAKDPKTYTNPETFFPERFLASEGRAKEADPRDYIFGFGRRYVFSPSTILIIRVKIRRFNKNFPNIIQNLSRYSPHTYYILTCTQF